MGKITFILGGARSGKSRFAVKLAQGNGRKVAFIATCLPLDSEMKKRIGIHKKTRPSHWRTFEAPRDISSLLKQIGHKFETIIIDCLTLLVSNLLLKGLDGTDIESRVNKILRSLKKIKAKAIIVSNETGLGIVPENKLARDFRDISGRINQTVASKSDEVIFMLAGLPLKIK
jgi:adenosylcobinamide kinase/adenosylcobinamide-phosphate guanylyltransferase